MKVVVEFDLPEGQAIPDPRDIVRLTDPDWHADWWHIEDVQSVASDLSDDEARRVLEIMARKGDANIGINWDSIDAWADWVRDERPDDFDIVQVGESWYVYDAESNKALEDKYFASKAQAEEFFKQWEEQNA